MSTIRSKREADIFLAGAAKYGTISNSLYVHADESLHFPGVRWLASLDITVNDGAEVHFPDLEVVSNNITVSASNGGMAYLPKLAEVGDGITLDIADNGDDSEDEFSCLSSNHTPDYVPVVMPDKIIGYTPRVSVRQPIYLANDRYHTLFYRPDDKTFHAGCQHFKSIDAAIKHWTTAVEEEEGDEWPNDRLNRALMFVLALTNFKKELKHVR